MRIIQKNMETGETIDKTKHEGAPSMKDPFIVRDVRKNIQQESTFLLGPPSYLLEKEIDDDSQQITLDMNPNDTEHMELKTNKVDFPENIEEDLSVSIHNQETGDGIDIRQAA